jgi:hypothetical protein
VIVAGPFDDRFLTVEEEQLDRQWILPAFQRAGQLEQERRARAAVARADERELLKQFRVVVAADDDARGC